MAQSVRCEGVVTVLRELSQESLTRYKAKIVGIFGSVARGDEREESDIDVLVDFSDNADIFDLVGLSLFLEENLHKRIDVVPRDTISSDAREKIMKETVYV